MFHQIMVFYAQARIHMLKAISATWGWSGWMLLEK